MSSLFDDEPGLLSRVMAALGREVEKEVNNLVDNLRDHGDMRDAQGHIRGLRRAVHLIQEEIHPTLQDHDQDEEIE